MALNPIIFSPSVPKFLFLLLLEAFGFLQVVPAPEDPGNVLPEVAFPDFLMVEPLSHWSLSPEAAPSLRS